MTTATLQAVDLTPYGKTAFGRLPTGLGKPAAGFLQLHSHDDEVRFLSILGLTLYRGTHDLMGGDGGWIEPVQFRTADTQ